MPSLQFKGKPLVQNHHGAPLVPHHTVMQPSLFGDCEISEAVRGLSTAGIEARGAIFTKREVVDFILDLAGFTTDRPLHELRLLEPSFGGGDFLFAAVERILAKWDSAKHGEIAFEKLAYSLRAVELHGNTFEKTREKLLHLLSNHGFSRSEAKTLSEAWLIHGDFLLVQIDGEFDFVVGNPPYVRQEMIPDALMQEYRARYRTVYDRADLYIPFIERSLLLLKRGRNLAFICADRWMKNRYGGPLRQLIAKDFHLKIYVDMVDTPAFHTEVVAYPAIMVISREKGTVTRIAYRPDIRVEVLHNLAKVLTGETGDATGASMREAKDVVSGDEPWLLDSAEGISLVRRLEQEFPTLEEAGCKVGIGVATGADKAYIGPFEELDVEADRKLPLVTTKDILTGEVEWKGLGVINPFDDSGSLVDLAKHPRLQKYLEARREIIAGRHVAEKAPENWYRTIDRIYPALVSRPKLLIPDIKGKAQIVFEKGELYPHHNLYHITSEKWNLKALQAVLLSGIARMFVQTYSTKMRGGFLRFQAQYLRRIRVPNWDDVPYRLQRELIESAERKDVPACNEAAFKLYGLTPLETAALTFGEGHGN